MSYAPAIAMRVAVAELNVRSAPSTAGEKVYLARRGDVVLAHDWPVISDGYTWSFGRLSGLDELPTLPEIFPPGDPLAGWIAASSPSGTYMVALPPRCPAAVNLPNVAAMLESERLACFGSRSLEFQGYLGCGFCEGLVGIGTPGWLANDRTYSVLVADEDHGLPLFFPTGVPDEDDLGYSALVRGHFDDPAAATCSIGLQDNDGQFELDPGIAREFCRGRFVVDEITVHRSD